jgi:putative peptidoglycan lipid II flippase
VATLLFWALLLTVGLGIVGAPLLILAIATGFSGSPAFEASVVMTQIMFPYIGLISMVSLSAGILNTFQRFAIPAFTPVLLNLALIGSALWLAPQLDQPIYALAFGVLVGGVCNWPFKFLHSENSACCHASASCLKPFGVLGSTPKPAAY